MDNPSLEGLLDDQQLEQLGRIKIGLYRLKDAIERINALAAETGLPLRPIPDFPLGLMGNDISQLAFSHELAEKRIRAAAFEAVERRAA